VKVESAAKIKLVGKQLLGLGTYSTQVSLPPARIGFMDFVVNKKTQAPGIIVDLRGDTYHLAAKGGHPLF
jgi:hypothetical protein